MKACWRCAEQVQDAAIACRFCGADFRPKAAAGERPRVDASIERGWFMVGGILAAVVGLLVAIDAWRGDTGQQEVAAAVSPAEKQVACAVAISAAQDAGLVRDRPKKNRIDVEEADWSALPAGEKRSLASAVQCFAAPDHDYGVVYGYRSGERLAVAGSFGVTLY